MKLRTVSVEDALSAFALRDTVVVLPTLAHAIHWFPRLRQAVYDRHGTEGDTVVTTPTTCVSRRTKTFLAIHVPYAPDPTMRYDFFQNRLDSIEFVSLYTGMVI